MGGGAPANVRACLMEMLRQQGGGWGRCWSEVGFRSLGRALVARWGFGLGECRGGDPAMAWMLQGGEGLGYALVDVGGWRCNGGLGNLRVRFRI